ncbi:MAG: pyridoxamine 5'-phosphate oxidase family protein [Candidatus Liptonbacteria bacterium]|nr:pyridoxamine 5'-phosphate oxidase family protein [Candidatus Liptonbacteria bacterium]
MDFTKRAKEIIEKILYITIASVTPDGKPWSSPVYSAYDKKNYTFYWVSPVTTQHTKNIAAHPEVFLVIYDSTVPEGTGEGVYIQARAEEVKDEAEMRHAIGLLYSRKSKPPRDAAQFTGDSPRRIYKAKPLKAWMNDSEESNGVHLDKRVEIQLP